MRDELLNGEMFRSLTEARVVINAWLDQYNNFRPHWTKTRPATVGLEPSRTLWKVDHTAGAGQTKREPETSRTLKLTSPRHAGGIQMAS